VRFAAVDSIRQLADCAHTHVFQRRYQFGERQRLAQMKNARKEHVFRIFGRAVEPHRQIALLVQLLHVLNVCHRRARRTVLAIPRRKLVEVRLSETPTCDFAAFLQQRLPHLLRPVARQRDDRALQVVDVHGSVGAGRHADDELQSHQDRFGEIGIERRVFGAELSPSAAAECGTRNCVL
jgi:hypothetical protein